MDNEISKLVKYYLLGNEDAQIYNDVAIYRLAEQREIEGDTDEWHYYICGASAYRFNGDTFETPSYSIEETQ